MTFQPIAGEITRISPAAKAVLTRAAAKSKGTATASELADKLFRDRVRQQLIKGANPNHYSWELVQELEDKHPAVRKAVTRWFQSRCTR
jgi:hypothetical protein